MAAEPEHSRPRKHSRALYSAIDWTVLLLVWIIFTGSTSPAELAAGTMAAAAGAAVSGVLAAEDFARFHPHGRWLLVSARLPAAVVRDVAVLTALLVTRLLARRHFQGRLSRVPFAAGRSDPHAAARRALAVALTSVAPCTYVLDIDRKGGEATVHRLAAARGQPVVMLAEEQA